MRVRYGKPIKVKSLLGKSNISFSITAKNGGWGVASKNNCSFKEGWPSGLYSATDTIKTNITANHVYFAFYSVTSTLQYKYARNCPKLYFSDGTVVFGNENQNKYYSALGFCCSILEPTISGSALLHIQNYNDFWTIGDTINYAFMIDITDIYESSMTAQQFYNKYNKSFSLIATGEEITIDDKAGQVSFSLQKSLKSIVGKQIDLTADSSFQEYSITSTPTVALGDNKFGYSTVIKQASRFEEGISIISGHQYFISVNVYNMIDRSAQRWMCIRFTAGKTGQTMLTDNKYSYQWYFTSDRVNAVLTATSSGDLGYVYFGDFPSDQKMTIATEYPESYLIVDLTDTFGVGNEPTAETFYTNYHNLFKDLENGKSLVIGKGKVAGGSSSTYYGYNQSADISQTTSSLRGLDYTVEGLGTLSISGTSEQSENKVIGTFNAIQNHKYLALTNFITGTPSTSTYWIKWIKVAMGKDIGTGLFFTSDTTSSSAYIMFIVEGANIQVNCKMQFQIIDLTDWFGAGKEPCTLVEFREKFIKDYYGFCPTAIKLTRYQIEALPSYGYNQMLKNGNFIDSSNWAVNTTSQRQASIENNIYTIETLTQGYAVSIEQSGNAQFLYADHKYLVSFEARGTSAGSNTHLQASIKLYSYANSATIFNQSYQNLTDEFQEIASIITPTQTTSGTSASGGFRIYYQSNTGLSYVGDKVQMKNIYVVDLTDWYGSGNEPTTVAEFKATFPNKYYPYSKKRLLNKYMINKLIN